MSKLLNIDLLVEFAIMNRLQRDLQLAAMLGRFLDQAICIRIIHIKNQLSDCWLSGAATSH
jgi:hypothetical protein